MRIDSDAVMWSAPERERAGRGLLILLHGFGSTEGDMFAFSRSLPLAPVIASVRAPLRAGAGYTWFPTDDPSSNERFDSIVDVTGALIDWVDSTTSTGVGVLGLSQGGAMAIEMLRTQPERFEYAVQLSGFVLPSVNPGDSNLAARRPPVFWGRGTRDEEIPASLIEHTEEWLPRHSTLTERIYEGLGHAVSDAELADVSAFIRAQG